LTNPASAAGAAQAAPATDSALPRRTKGARTRRRIMDATKQLLRARPFGEIRITEIARAADIAQPNFYTYFSSLEEVIRALAEDMSIEPFMPFFEVYWKGEVGLQAARGVTEAAIEYFRDHGVIFAIVNMLADQRHGEFPAQRARIMRAVYKAFEAKVRLAQAEGRLNSAIQPRLASYEFISIITSAGARYDLFRASGFSHEQLVDTTARIIFRLAGGD